MKLEHRRERVASLYNFLFRMAHYALFSFALIIVSVGLGTIGYHHFGQLGWLDSFYMSCMILTGMGPVEDMTTQGGKLFSSFFALYSGVAFLSITAVFFAPIVKHLFKNTRILTNVIVYE